MHDNEINVTAQDFIENIFSTRFAKHRMYIDMNIFDIRQQFCSDQMRVESIEINRKRIEKETASSLL